MQRYHNESIISTYNSRSSQLRREREAKANMVLESYALERDMAEAIESEQENILNESFMQSVRNDHVNARNRRDFSNLSRLEEVYNENCDSLCKDIFFYVVYESLLVDDNIKSKPDNFNYIRESCNKFFDVMSSNNKITIVEGSAFDDFMTSATTYLKESIDNSQPIDLKNIIKKTIISEDMLMHYAIGSVKAKTAECIKNEKTCTSLKESLVAEEKYVDPSKTLFRYLFESNIQEVIDNSVEKDPQALQDLSMVETILDYSILEAANTLQLVSFDSKLKKIVNS